MRFIKVLIIFVLGNLFLTNVGLLAQKPVLDSLINLRNLAEGRERMMFNKDIAEYYISHNEDSARYYILEIEKYSTEEDDLLAEAHLYKLRASLLRKLMDLESAMDYYRRAYDLFKELGDQDEMGWTSRSLGTIHYDLGNYANATERLLISLQAFKETENKCGIADSYIVLGAIYYTMGHSDKAHEYYNSALDLFREAGDELRIAKVINNIGILQYDDENYEEALNSYTRALQGFEEAGYIDGKCGSLGNMALCYQNMGQYSKALEYAHQSRSIATVNGQTLDMASAYVNIGSFYRELNRRDSAMHYLLLASEISGENSFKPILLEAYNELALLFEASGDYRNAFENHIKYFELNEELHQEESRIRIENLMLSYEQELKQHEIDLLTADQQTQTLLNKVFGAVVLVSVLLLVVMVYSYTAGRKKSKLLEEKNRALTEYIQKLQDSEDTLKKTIDDKNKLFTIIAHDLRNPVAAVSGFSELLMDNYEQLDNATRQEYIAQISQGSGRTYDLLENLLLWARSQMDSIVVKKTSTSLRKLIDESMLAVQASIHRKEIKIVVSGDCDAAIYVDHDMMKAVFRNLLTNAVKFSFPGGKVEINCQKTGKKYRIDFIDHGIGIEREIIEALFKAQAGKTTPGTSGESGSGLGLLICKDYTERNGGTLTVESKPGEGSTFRISLPVSENAT